jgi:hypothetical protein
MSTENTYSGKLGSWQRLIVPLLENPPGLSHMEPFRAKLAALFTRAVEIGSQQAALTAGKQELSQELQTLMADGERLAGAIRKCLREHYGPKAEKLAAYGLQPFRGRKLKNDPELPPLPVGAASPALDPDSHR